VPVFDVSADRFSALRFRSPVGLASYGPGDALAQVPSFGIVTSLVQATISAERRSQDSLLHQAFNDTNRRFSRNHATETEARRSE
jgi:hypothetical protein